MVTKDTRKLRLSNKNNQVWSWERAGRKLGEGWEGAGRGLGEKE
jgi:hypothetical protein